MATISSSDISLKWWKNGSPYSITSFTAPSSTSKTVTVGNCDGSYWGICIKFKLDTAASEIKFKFKNGSTMPNRNALLQYKFTSAEDTGFTGAYTQTGSSIRWGTITADTANTMTITQSLAAGTHYFYLWPEQSVGNYPYDYGNFLYDTSNFSITYTKPTDSNVALKWWKGGSPYSITSFTAPTSTAKTVTVGNASSAQWGICIRFKVPVPITKISFNFTNGSSMPNRNALLQYKFTTSEDTSFTGLSSQSGTAVRWGTITANAANTMSFTKNFAAGTHYFYLWPQYSTGSYPYDHGNFVYSTSKFSISYTVATSYTISYNANGYGTAPSSQTKYKGTALALQPFISDQSITGYKVSFNNNGGSSTPSAITSTITKGQTYWNTASDGSGTNYSSGGSYSSNAAATMYAIWGNSTNNAITLPAAISRADGSSTYTVTYNANGGTSTPSQQTLTRKTPYTFSKWAKGSTSGTKYSAGASYTPSAATTMYATWTAGTNTGSVTLASAISKSNTTQSGYKVTFNANGGTCDTTELTATDTVKWTFSKWNTKSDGSGTDYSAGGTYSSDSNLTLYAKWTSSISSRGSITLPSASRTGYTFKGWATSSSATSGSTGSYTPTSSTTLYAVWQINTWTVSYNANGHGTAPSSQTKTYGTTLKLQSFIPQQTATGYTVGFNSNGGISTSTSLTSTIYYDQTYWNTASDGSGTNYSSGGNYTTNAAATMYAIWKTTKGSITLPDGPSRISTAGNGYTVTFNANGGTCDTASLTATRVMDYTFSKWAAGSTSGTQYSAGASYTPTANTTMYAIWNESIVNGSVNLPVASRPGYNFLGWSTSSTASAGVTGSYTPSGDVTLYAVWEPAGAVRIYYNGSYKIALLWIYQNGTWKLTIPYVKQSDGWKISI